MKGLRRTPNIALLLLSFAVSAAVGRRARNVEELSRCVRMAEPLVHNPDFVFPLTNQEIHDVCRMWGAFVDCVRSYTQHFLQPDKLEAFTAAIEPSMQSIHQLCDENVDYRAAYLSFAPCMKRTYISPEHCGSHYRYLADLVQGSASPHTLLCCAHHKFRSCVLSRAPRECEGTVAADDTSGKNITATQFVTAMLDRALGFLLQQCTEYRPTEANCPGLEVSNELDNGDRALPEYSVAGLPIAPSPSLSSADPSYRRDSSSSNTSSPWELQPYVPTDPLTENDVDSPPRFHTRTQYNRALGGNRLDNEPKTQQFRGISGGGTGISSGLVQCLVPVALTLAGLRY